MILAIDIGNSNIVLGCIRDGEILFEARMATDRIKTKDQYCAELKAMLELFRVSPAEIDGCIVSSVVPQIQQSLVEAAERLTGKACLTVGPGLKTGLRIKIDNPAQAGSDLIVGAVAAIDAYGTGLCVIDMGTATTICAIDREGAFLGGTIAPGVMLSLNALTSGTAQLPGISLSPDGDRLAPLEDHSRLEQLRQRNLCLSQRHAHEGYTEKENFLHHLLF